MTTKGPTPATAVPATMEERSEALAAACRTLARRERELARLVQAQKDHLAILLAARGASLGEPRVLWSLQLLPFAELRGWAVSPEVLRTAAQALPGQAVFVQYEARGIVFHELISATGAHWSVADEVRGSLALIGLRAAQTCSQMKARGLSGEAVLASVAGLRDDIALALGTLVNLEGLAAAQQFLALWGGWPAWCGPAPDWLVPPPQPPEPTVH